MRPTLASRIDEIVEVQHAGIGLIVVGGFASLMSSGVCISWARVQAAYVR